MIPVRMASLVATAVSVLPTLDLLENVTDVLLGGMETSAMSMQPTLDLQDNVAPALIDGLDHSVTNVTRDGPVS